MADDWWSALLERMFGTVGRGQLEHAKAQHAFGEQVNREFQRHEQAARQAQTAPTPQPSAAPQQQGNPNATETEQAQGTIDAKLGGITSGLYKDMPRGKVFLGNRNVQRGKNYVRQPILEDIGTVVAQVNDWSPKKIAKFNELAIAAGFIKEPTKNLDDIERIWGALAVRSAKMWETGTHPATPWQLLERYGTGRPGETGPYTGPVTTTSVSRNVNLSSPREANALIDEFFSQRFGRAATKEEKKKFVQALNKAEKDEPTTTKTTTTVTGSGTPNVSQTSNTTTSGGVNTQSFAEEFSLGHNKDEAGSHQALAFYMPAFFQALGAPV